MSYKKIEDIDYLYNNIQEELEESLKHSLGVLYEEMEDRGYSDTAISSYFETVDIIELHEKLELLSENPVKNPNNWRKAWDIIRNAGRRIGGSLRRNTPLNVRVPVHKANQAVKSTVNQGKEIIKKNPTKSSVAGVGGLAVASAATNSNSGANNNNDKKGENRLGLDGSINVPGLGKTIKTREGATNNKVNNNTSSNQKSTAEIRAKNKEDGGSGMSNISPKEGNAKINGKEINPNFGKETQVNKDAAKQRAALDAGAVERQDKPTASVKSQIDAYQKGRPSPASFNTNQRQTRDLVKSQSKQVYPSITDKDLNQFSRSKKYTADDGKTQVDRSTVFTKAKFDFGNIKKGQELGVLTKSQRKQYDLKASSFKEEVAIDENRMASHTAGMSDAQKDAASSSVSKSTADKMGRRSDEAAFKGRKKKTSARYSSTGGKKRKNTTGRGQPEQYRKSADDDKNEARFPYGRSNIVQGKGSFKGLKKEDFDAFDIVLGYLVESEQVDSIDEALYVMMEMDAATIQSIVRDFENLYEEAADREKDRRLELYGIGHDGSDKKAGSKRRSGGKRPKGKTPLQKETEKKYGKGKTAVDIVRAKIEKEHGKGAIAD
tara:strand:+ start:1729 stop:3543 length:1815 start_codon:yes stop_codon:yes gene_type:complete